MPMSPRLLRPRATGFDPRSISGLALWLDAADSSTLYTTDAGPVTAVSAPTEISGCVLWMDGADNATITASGGLVSQWTDKSATAAVLTASGSARPTLSSTGFNSRQALVFNGTSTNMASVSPYTATNGLSAMTRIAVCQNVSGNSVVARVFNGGSDMFVNMNGSWRSAVDATSGTNFVNSASFSNSNTLPAGVYADVFSSATITQYGLGSAATVTVNGTIPATTGTGTPTLHVGSNIGVNFFWNGPIAEVIYFNRALTRAELSRVESYLAAKWGISGVHAPATATNDPVGAWLDKSGNGRHATQATGTSRPTISATALNGKKQLGLISQHLRGPSTAWNGSATIYWVGRTGQATAGAMVFHDGFTGDQSQAFHTGWLNTQGVGAYGNGWNAGNAPRAESPSAWRAADIVAGVTLSTTEAVARVNGAAVNTVAALAGTLSQASAAQFYVGRDGDGTWTNLNGSLAEILIYQPALSASQRTRLERHLGAKWGITLAPQVSNADAQDWINRVYANGGTVSATTATAVNTFCNDIENAGIRDRFYRLNLFCGNSDASLNAVRTPLFRGPSLGGTQYGGTTDAIANFVQGDYAETGASSGLKGNGTTKSLNTGVNANALIASDSHMGFGLRETQTGAAAFRTLGGAFISPNTFEMSARRGDTNRNCFFTRSSTASDQAGEGVQSASLAVGDVLMAYPAFYRNGVQSGVAATTSQNYPSAHSIFVFALNGPSFGGAINQTDARINWYSIGLSMTAAQALSFYNATAAFNSSLSRT
jgi:hypothetical protein